MLNIGRLAPGAADYYVGEVASSAEDYYSGRGEAQGRWVGSLARRLGLHGAVRGEQFRAVLDGRHPQTGEQLARSRAGTRRQGRTCDPNQTSLFDEELDISRVASRLRVTVGRVRQLAWAGDEARRGERPARFLVGRKQPLPGRPHPLWMFRRTEVERYEAEHGRHKARPGYDLTLRPPKSVSVLWALADADQQAVIRRAHAESVDAVVAYIEAHALYARRSTKERGRIETDGLVAAAFDHRTSRAGDPLLHTHVVTANLTRTAEGRWQAIDGRPLFTNARSAGFLYQAHLRHLLARRLGIQWEPVHNGWAEITGVPKAVVRAFSKRRDEIEETIAESGYTSARAHQLATLTTRRAKEYGVEPATLAERWRQEAEALGFGPAEVAACFNRTPDTRPLRAEALLDELAGPDGLTRQASTFERSDVVEALSERAADRLDAQAIDALVDRFLASDRVTPLAPAPCSPEGVWRRDGSRTRATELATWSTPELLGLEQRLLDQAAGNWPSPVSGAHPDAVSAALSARPELSAEQVEMVRALCTPDAPPIQPVAGRPGSGKTHATAAAVEAFVASGVPVVGCALSATAAAELEASARLGPLTGRGASTIARLLLELRRHPLAPGTVLIVDESSMVGTRDLARLADHVASVGGPLKLIGDPDQHGAVEAGGFFRLLCDQQGDRLVQLVENNRQQTAGDREAIEDFRHGLVQRALASYDGAGRIVRSPTAAASYDTMVADWWEQARTGSRDPMIAGPNRIRRALNHRARRRLAADGALSGRPLIAAEREFQVGDWVVARHNARSLRSDDGGWVKNGSAGVVTAIDHRHRRMTVAFDREGRIELPAWYLDGGHLDHGYARTTYGVQGATLDRALYHAGDQASFEEGYVALTRGRHETRLYLVDGAAPLSEPDDTHPGHDPGSTGLSTVAAALERRRAKALAHQTDSRAAPILDTFASWTLSELHAERQRLETVLAQAPPDVSAALTAHIHRGDALRAERRIRAEELRLVTVRPRPRLRWHRTTALGERAEQGLRDAIERLDRSLAHAERREAELRERWRQRAAWLDDHSPEVQRLQLVRHAEQARELQLRAEISTRLPEAVAALVGPEPSDPAARQAWRHAAEEAAVHLERYGALDPSSGHEHWSHASIRHSLRCLDEARTAALEVEPDLR